MTRLRSPYWLVPSDKNANLGGSRSSWHDPVVDRSPKPMEPPVDCGRFGSRPPAYAKSEQAVDRLALRHSLFSHSKQRKDGANALILSFDLEDSGSAKMRSFPLKLFSRRIRSHPDSGQRESQR